MMMMHQVGESGALTTSDYWLLKILAQQFDLRIYFDKPKVRQADQALLTGKILLSPVHQMYVLVQCLIPWGSYGSLQLQQSLKL